MYEVDTLPPNDPESHHFCSETTIFLRLHLGSSRLLEPIFDHFYLAIPWGFFLGFGQAINHPKNCWGEHPDKYYTQVISNFPHVLLTCDCHQSEPPWT